MRVGCQTALVSSKIHAMDAAILAVGSELLGIDRLDTNSLLLTRTLGAFGVELERKVVAGDDVEVIAQEVGRLSRTVDLLLITGGLGPTADDLTREGVARALDRRLIADEKVLDDIERKFERFGMPMPAVNRRQAELIDGASWLTNRRGTAPGMQIEADECVLFVFPGVPSELEEMIEIGADPLARTAQRRRADRNRRCQGGMPLRIGGRRENPAGLRGVRQRENLGPRLAR